ncbi:MAG TPA: hypothetical protein VGO66_02080 [Solirubrobacterales bacterium]|jgi:hypothetical protein|nr:hypothetical protein [Solirubrobacterales bacterium]
MSLQAMFGRGGWLAAVLVGVLAFAAPAASASPASNASKWLAGELVEETHYEVVFGEKAFDDAGLTADGLLAFETTAAATPAAATATWLTSGEYPDAYVGDGKTESYAGSLGKLGAALAAHGLDPNDPADTGGRKLMTDLVALQQGNGRFADKPVDFSNPFGQSWATLALAACGRGACTSVPAGAAEAVEDSAAYLRTEQCPNGGFPSQFEEGECSSDVDSTGIVAQALIAEESGASEAAAEAAVAWLELTMSGAGNFWESSACEPPGPSANSTALAMMGLSAWGASVSGSSDWLESIQNEEEPDFGLPRCSASGAGNVRATVQGVYGLGGSLYGSYMEQLGLP